MKIRLARVAVFAAFALAACGGDSSDPTAPQNPEVPQGPEVPGPGGPGGSSVSLDEVLDQLGDVSMYAAAGMAGLGVSPASGLPASSTTACPYDAATKYFICPAQSQSGITVGVRYQLLNAGGTPLAQLDASLASLRYVVDVGGAIDLGDGNGLDIDSHDEQLLTGLQTATRVVNGTGATDLSMTANGQVLSVTVTRAINDLVLPSEPGPNAYPTSGSITTSATAEGVTFTSTMTFNGTSTVTIVNAFNGTPETCTFDLASPETPPLCS